MFNYKIIDHKNLLGTLGYIDIKSLEEELNKIGVDGWELVNVNCSVGGVFSVWKKKKD